jgi:DNA-binding beta-propeller fold protein YncE
MLPYAHRLTFSLFAITIFFSVLPACAWQRPSVSPTEPVNTSLPIQTSVSATSHPLPTPVLHVLTDSASMHIGKIIPISDGFPEGLVFARQRLWVLRRRTSFLPPGSILEIDPDSGQIVGKPIQVDFDPWSFAVTEGAIWVAKNGPATVVHIDPETRQIVATIDIDASLVAADVHGVWVSGAGENAVNANTTWRVNPLTNQLVGTPIPVGIEPLRMVAGAGAVWVGAHSGPPAITRIDPETGKVLATIEVGFGIHGLATGPDSVWAVDYHGQKVVRISPQTNQIVGKPIRVPFQPYAAAASATDAWVGVAGISDDADPTDDRVVRIDLRTNTIVDTIHVGGHTIAMVFANGSLWVATVRPSLIVQVIPQALTR